METYEIRIINEVSRPAAIISAAHVSDYSAVRSARKLAGNRTVEVWHGIECIYRREATKPTRPYRRTKH